MNIFLAEFIGTTLMILLGNGVVATCCLKGTKCGGSEAAQWMVITTAWGFAVFVGVIVAGPISGAHLNPAVTLGLAIAHKISWNLVPSYIVGEFFGAILGALLVWIFYKDHFKITDDESLKRACFCTEPAIRNYSSNVFSEFLGTFVLIFVILYITGASINLPHEHNAQIGLGSIGALPVAILVWVIGLSLGSTTGYAINPFRDLCPRLVLHFLPLRTNSDWSYAWVPILGPLIGASIAAILYNII